jgi:hypothetical protein
MRSSRPWVGAAAVIAMLGTAAIAAGASSTLAAYRSQVNGICASYTPQFKKVEADMARAKRTGNARQYAYDVGFALALTLKQGRRIEAMPVPADGRTAMASPLRLLHRVDLQLARVTAAAVAGDNAAFQIEGARLTMIAAPLNRTFDSVGLRACGSGQT